MTTRLDSSSFSTRSPRVTWILGVKALLALLIVLPALGGCASASRSHVMFDGHSGVPIQWDDLLERVEQAEAVLVGEQHDDAAGHAVQRALFDDAARRLEGRTALSMEMIETDRQHHVDAYLDRRISRSAFIDAAGVERWRGWKSWYQPIVDTARSRRAPVVAANAPRPLVTAARVEGFDHVRSLEAFNEGLVILPLTIEDGRAEAYRIRFFEVMGVVEDEPESTPAPTPMHGGIPVQEDEEESDDEKPAPAAAHGHRVTPEQGLAFFRSQMVWDASMAERIARALDRADVDRVIHLVGRFHSDFDGGTVLELRARRPGARILTVSLVPAASSELRDEDRGRADIVIYTR